MKTVSNKVYASLPLCDFVGRSRAAANKVLPLLVPTNREAGLNGFDRTIVQGSIPVVRDFSNESR